MSVEDRIRELEQRCGAKVFARIPFGENGTWGVNVQFHRLNDGAFLEAHPCRDFVTRQEWRQAELSAGVIKAE